jgi:ankyrin
LGCHFLVMSERKSELPSINLLLAQQTGTIRQHRKNFRAREAGLSADSHGVTPLHRAAVQGDVAEIRRLLRAGSDVNRPRHDLGQSALHLVAVHGDVPAAQALVHAGATVGSLDKAGNTPLLTAVREGQVSMAGMLLRRGADTNKAAKDGDTPLLVACRNNLGVQFVSRLLQFKANPDIASPDGVTPLHIAAGAGQVDVVHVLRKARASADLETATGDTALILASRNGHAAAVQTFLSAGKEEVDGNVNVIPSTGESALQVAARSGHRAVVEELLRGGADAEWAKQTFRYSNRRRSRKSYEYKGEIPNKTSV